jgi:hypothetical protein
MRWGDDVMDTVPGNGFFGWLGRQVGYLRRAVQTDVSRQKVYENRTVEEAALPQDPNVKLRRTTIDEVIVEKKTSRT